MPENSICNIGVSDQIRHKERQKSSDGENDFLIYVKWVLLIVILRLPGFIFTQEDPPTILPQFVSKRRLKRENRGAVRMLSNIRKMGTFDR